MKQRIKSLSKFFTILVSLVFAVILTLVLSWSISQKFSLIVFSIFISAAILFSGFYFWFHHFLYPRVLPLFAPKDFLPYVKWWLSITQSRSLLSLYEKILRRIHSSVELKNGKEGASIFLYEPKGKYFYRVSPFFSMRPAQISADMLLSCEMEKESLQILFASLLKKFQENDALYKERYEALLGELDSLKAEVFIPLRLGQKFEDFVGFITLGEKKNGEPYTLDEVKALQRIAIESKSELMYAMMYAAAEEKREEFEERKEEVEPFFLKKFWHELNIYQKVIGGYFVVMVVYWILLQYSGSKDGFWNYFYSFAYGLVPLFSGIGGCILSKHLGYLKTVTGRALFFISLGSFFWGVGNLVFAYYNFFAHVSVPYPSIADIGYALSFPAWIYGSINLAIATGTQNSLKSDKKKMASLLIPIFVLILSYYLLVIVARGGTILLNPENNTKLILDLFYPSADIVNLTLALLVFGLSSRSLIKKYRFSVPLMLVGFIIMYFADFAFSYTTTIGTFYVGFFGELLFISALYFISVGALGLPLEPSKYPKALPLTSKKEKMYHGGILGSVGVSLYVLIIYLVIRFSEEVKY